MNDELNTVFVGNLSFNTDKNGLEAAFGQYGNIVEVNMPTDRETGRLRGFAFIKFDAASAAEQSLAMDGQEVDGRPLRVSIAHGKKTNNVGGGDRRGGSSNGGGNRSWGNRR